MGRLVIARARSDRLGLRNCMEVEGGHNPMQPFKGKVPCRLKHCGVFDRRSHFAIDKNMSVACLCTKSSGEIHDCADRAIVATALEAD